MDGPPPPSEPSLVDLLNRMEQMGADPGDLQLANEIAGDVAEWAAMMGAVAGPLWDASGQALLFAYWAWWRGVDNAEVGTAALEARLAELLVEHERRCIRCGRAVDLRSPEAGEWATIPQPLEPALSEQVPMQEPVSVLVCPDCLTDDERLLARRLRDVGA